MMAKQTDRSTWAEKVWAGELDTSETRIDDNLKLVRRIFDEVWNIGNVSLIDELLAPSYVDHNPSPGAPPDRQGYQVMVNQFRSAFPDINFTFDQVLTEGDRVAIRLTGRGSHQGVFMGIAPTGKQVSFGGMTFLHMQDGKVTESWGISDIPGLMGQLGAVPGQSQPAASHPRTSG